MQPLFWVHLLSLQATYQEENSYSSISTHLLEPAENELLLPKFKMHNFPRKIGKSQSIEYSLPFLKLVKTICLTEGNQCLKFPEKLVKINSKKCFVQYQKLLSPVSYQFSQFFIKIPSGFSFNRLQFFCEALKSIQLCIGASQDTLCILGKINLQSEQIFLQQEIPE